jgi:GNAT superfamily N-acetyltransferase
MDIRIVNIRPEHAPALEQLQRDCFPTLGADELMTAEHFLSHVEVFPEGDFVALAAQAPDGAELARERVVGLGSGFFTDFDFDDPGHTFQEIIAGGYYTNHDPSGDWYYGGDISVHPDYRGHGIGSMLYDARKDLVRRYGKRGIVAGGVLPGYAANKDAMSVSEYVDRVRRGELFDPTLSFQLKHGFEVRGLLEGYLEDSASDDWATLIVWTNPQEDS